MASPQKLEMEGEVKYCNAEKFWECIKNSTTLFPKAFPDKFESIEVLEGDGKSAGTILLVRHAKGFDLVPFTKEKLEIVDDETKTIVYSIIGGDLMNYYKSFRGTVVVSPKGEGCYVKWSYEFVKTSEEVPNPDAMMDLLKETLHGLEAYLLKA